MVCVMLTTYVAMIPHALRLFPFLYTLHIPAQHGYISIFIYIYRSIVRQIDMDIDMDSRSACGRVEKYTADPHDFD